ncbi:MAG: response regulator [Flavobacteriales bacterium]|nr:response regulator [Flavobacteriales bacterium]
MSNKLSAIIVDDESRARSVLRNLLSKSNFEVDVLAECSNLPEAVDKINELKPTVVFLDVQMPQYAGYEIVRFFDEIDFEIIFVTAYDQFAIRAFELNAMDYIVKPIERERLTLSLQKLESSVTAKIKTQEYQHLLNSIQEKTTQKIIIPEVGNRRIINLDEIIAIEANGSYTTFHMVNTENFMVSKNLKYFENRLGDDPRFFRSHRASIVNLDYIERFNKKEYTILLKKDVRMKIARGRISDFEQIMM